MVLEVEGELVDGVLGGREAFRAQGEGAYAGALEAEAGEEGPAGRPCGTCPPSPETRCAEQSGIP
ncbi:hypothetical protein ACZ90_32105, partial [Streptomyces albus subsp. albus]